MIGDKQKGVTLIEMMVAAVVFSIVFAVCSGVFVSAIKIQKYNLSQHQLMDETAYAIEYISRALRMAQMDESNLCDNGVVNYAIKDGGSRIEFLNYKGECQEFYWDVNSEQIKVTGGGFTGDIPLTSSKYTVNDLNFVLTGDDVIGDNFQPKVTFFLDVESKLLQDKPRIKLQTSISQRNLDK